MKKVISVRFKENGKSYYFDPGDAVIHTGEYVIVETARGVECGEVVQGARELADAAVPKALKPITRMADSVDIRRMRQNREDEKRAYHTCQECIARHGLEMKLVEAEYTLDRSKIMFYFTADGRVDFRELVKDLAGIFHTRIELRQIGVRDESKMIGGLGICGQPFCCSRFLKDFQPVSIKMAKEQGVASHRYRDRHSRTRSRTDASPPAAGGICRLAALVAFGAGPSALARQPRLPRKGGTAP